MREKLADARDLRVDEPVELGRRAGAGIRAECCVALLNIGILERRHDFAVAPVLAKHKAAAMGKIAVARALIISHSTANRPKDEDVDDAVLIFDLLLTTTQNTGIDPYGTHTVRR